MARLRDRVALVTGASRGAGKGIALVLGEEGATVYVTGRSVRGGATTLGRPGTIDDTADWEIEWRHWDLMFDGGLRAAAYASRLAAPPMIAAGRGLIVNITRILDRPHGHAFWRDHLGG